MEKRKQLSLTEEVILLSDEIQQKFSLLKLENRPQLDKTTLRDTLRLLRRYNLVQPLDRDVTLADARILVYPSILFAVPNDNLNLVHAAIESKLEQYTTGGESADDEETDSEIGWSTGIISSMRRLPSRARFWSAAKTPRQVNPARCHPARPDHQYAKIQHRGQ